MKRITIAAIALGTALMMFGCAAGGSSKTPGQTQGAQSRAEASARVYGKVVSIVGNQVVLLIGQPSTASSLASASSMRGQGSRSGQFPTGTGGQMPSGNGSYGSGSRSGSARSGYSGSGRSAASGSNSAASGTNGTASGTGSAGKSASRSASGSLTGMQASASADLVYGVATASYLLPAGMQIGTGDFTGVAKNNVLLITMDTAGTITSVSILSTK